MTLRDSDIQSRDILTKAVCGRGRQFVQLAQPFTPQYEPSTILGAWVINHSFDAIRTEHYVEVVGSYDMNLWYAYANNTKTDVAKETLTYVQKIELQQLDPHFRPSTVEVSARAIQEPNCVEATISNKDHKVIVRVEFELQAEIVAETQLRVLVYNDPSQKWAKHRAPDEDTDEDLIELFEEEEDNA
jgi:spore coat protein E